MQENKETADKDFCEIIQMACPYSHDCHVCRLYTDYEMAREKSEYLYKNERKYNL